MGKSSHFDTLAIHSGEQIYQRSVTQPIFQSSTYIFEGESQYTDVKYGRLSNTPNHQNLSDKLAALEKTEQGLVTSSGMSAVTTALLAFVPPGGRLLSQNTLYGGTHYFLKDDFPFWNRAVDFFPIEESGSITNYLKAGTAAIYLETISNPLLRVPDFEKIIAVAKSKNILTIIDNTFASPYNFNPIEMGFDIVLHSATKYLNGHTDVLAGAILGKSEKIEEARKLLCHLGPCLDPHACFLLNRGLKTLGIRMRQHNENALALAKHLQNLNRIEKVFYPGLESHPDHARAKKWFKGFGGMISFEYKGSIEDLERSLKRLMIPMVAPSLGGVESLITRPSTTSHSGLSQEERTKLGIKDTLVRLSVGLEDVSDLEADFTEAFG